MARLKVYKDNYIETTAVSNCFIDNYMQDANDAQLKVYLYLIRMIGANLPTSVSDIADKFNHTEKEVLRALKFWEKKKLLTLDFDENKNLVGVHLCPLSGNPADNNTGLLLQPKNEVEDAKEIRVSPKDIPLIPQEEPENPFEKPVYTADQLRSFQAKEDTKQLLFAAQMYIGKPLSSNEMKTILYFSDVLHFSEDLIDYLIQYCVDRDKRDFRYIEKVALSWAEQNITTVKQAKKVGNKYDKTVYEIMNALGKSGTPTQKEVDFIYRWTKEYGFSQDIIIEACERTVLTTDKHRFEYAEGILSSWKASQVHHLSDVKKLDELYLQRKSTPSLGGNGPIFNKFNQFQQNTYDFEALEKKLLSN